MFDTLNGYLHPDNPEKVQFLAERNILPNMQRLLAGVAVGHRKVTARGQADVKGRSRSRVIWSSAPAAPSGDSP